MSTAAGLRASEIMSRLVAWLLKAPGISDRISVTICEVDAFYITGGRFSRRLFQDEHGGKRPVMNRRLRNTLKELTCEDADRRRRAMEPFVGATFEAFNRCLYHYLGDEAECEDVLEDVYADIWEEPDHLRNVTSEKGLLRTVYLYYMRKRLREVYRRRNRHLYMSQNDLRNLVAPELGILEVASQSELLQIVRQMLRKLKTRERKAIEMWTEGMSNRAIANELRTTVGAVKMLEFRTILKLKKMLRDYCRQD